MSWLKASPTSYNSIRASGHSAAGKRFAVQSAGTLMTQQPIPEAAVLDENFVEMMLVWIAQKRLHTSLKVGMYRETSKVPEETA